MRDLPPFQNNPVFSTCKQCKSEAVCKKRDKCLLKAGEEFSTKFKNTLLEVTEALHEMRSPAGNTTEFAHKKISKAKKILAQGTQGKSRKVKDDHSFKHPYGRIQPGVQRAAHDKTSSAALQGGAVAKTRLQRSPETPLSADTAKRRQQTRAQEEKDLSASKVHRANKVDMGGLTKTQQDRIIKKLMTSKGLTYGRARAAMQRMSTSALNRLFS